MSVGHDITLKLDFDLKAEIWTAEIRYRELRGGKQYGGTVVTELTSSPDEDRAAFLKRVRRRAKLDMDLFWS